MNIKRLRENLLGWYDQHQRDLPWRQHREAYPIWLSEIMLQQTTVATVIPYYHRFLEKFPTLKAVAESPEGDLLKAWAGLGYYNRIRQFQKAAREIMENRGGHVPQTKAELLNLPGLGDYTAAAVASIAFGEPVAVVDGNVMRVLARWFRYDQDISSTPAKLFFREKAQEILEVKRPGDFNQAMMELGATVCTPRNPSCLLCPVQKDCAAFSAGDVEKYPVKEKKIQYRNESWLNLVALASDHILMRQRQEDEIMAGLWEFPQIVLKEHPSASEYAAAFKKEGLGLDSNLELLGEIKHTIMNRRIRGLALAARLDQKRKMGSYQWTPLKALQELPLTTVSAKILKLTQVKAFLK